MSTAISRMQLLRGDISGRAAPVRPPWAVAETDFVNRCERCGDCISKCPTGIIKKGRGGFPVIDFSVGECLFWGDCVSACKPGALSGFKDRQPWRIRASLASETCIAVRGVECRGCVDPCETRAIRMHPQIGGVSVPELDQQICNGCGACYAVCPVQAISMTRTQLQEAQ